MRETIRYYRCQMPDAFRNGPNYRWTVEDDRRVEAEKRAVLWHYTNIDALYKILSSRAFRFSRIDRVNDLLEKKPLEIDSVYKGVYVACFNHNSKEKIPLWNMYTKRGIGVRIELEFYDNKIHEFFYDINRSDMTEKYRSYQFTDFTSSMHDIEYSDEIKILPVIQNEKEIYIDPQAIAFEKTTAWDYEEETRILMFTVKYVNNDTPSHIDFLLDYSQIKSIKIVFDPWMSSEMKKSIELTVKHYMKDYPNLVCFENSELEGKIG